MNPAPAIVLFPLFLSPTSSPRPPQLSKWRLVEALANSRSRVFSNIGDFNLFKIAEDTSTTGQLLYDEKKSIKKGKCSFIFSCTQCKLLFTCFFAFPSEKSTVFIF